MRLHVKRLSNYSGQIAFEIYIYWHRSLLTNMATVVRKKIVKEAGQPVDELEEQVAQALFDLEATNS
eukprot:jgi/Picre1/32268/NNA_007614.t1